MMATEQSTFDMDDSGPAKKAEAPPNLVEKVENFRKSDKRKRQAEIDATPIAVQLPLWDETVRAIPNALARSALFTAANRNTKREQFKLHRIAALRGIEILYTGEELRQEDGDVFLQVVHMARPQPLGEAIEFAGYALLKELGWQRNKASYDRLREAINRLAATTVIVKTDQTSMRDAGYGGSLVRKFDWDSVAERGESQHWRIWLEPEIVVLFDSNAYTKLDWKQRLKLPPLAKFLHGFYFSHREPFGIKVETIKGLCGSKTAVLAKFRYKLREALNLLVEEQFLVSFRIDPITDVVTVQRVPRGQLFEHQR